MSQSKFFINKAGPGAIDECTQAFTPIKLTLDKTFGNCVYPIFVILKLNF